MSSFHLISARDIEYLFPVQYHTFDHIYDGNDIIVQARKLWALRKQILACSNASAVIITRMQTS